MKPHKSATLAVSLFTLAVVFGPAGNAPASETAEAAQTPSQSKSPAAAQPSPSPARPRIRYSIRQTGSEFEPSILLASLVGLLVMIYAYLIPAIVSL